MRPVVLLMLVLSAQASEPEDRVAAYARGELHLPSNDPDAVFTGRVAGDCAALPEALPDGFQALWHQTIVPHGKPFSRQIVGVTAERCIVEQALHFFDDRPQVDCRVLSAEALAERYAEIRRLYGSGFETTARKASPHVGSRTLTLRWAGANCSVTDSSRVSVADQERFYGVRDIIVR